MYSKKTIKELLITLNKYYKNPASELSRKTKLTYPTVRKFLSGNKLLNRNQDLMMDAITIMIEDAQKQRKLVMERGNDIAKFELALEMISKRKMP